MEKLISVVLILCVMCMLISAMATESPGLPEIRITLANGVTIDQINSGSKDTKYPGNFVEIQEAEGKDFSGYDDVELKGRGNFTWECGNKKPYQLKFDTKISILGMPKAKKWILIANYADVTLMRNKLAFDLALQMGFPAPESHWVDLYVNDSYLGNYLLCEKNEIGKGRVELKDDYGVLCEVDGNYGTKEDYYFTTAVNGNVIVLSDSVADDLGEENAKSELAFFMFQNKINAFEELLYSDTATWNEIAALIDVDSFIKYYFLQELCENSDGCYSSLYLYSDGVDDVIHLGPAWDFDIAFGQFNCDERGGNPTIDYTSNIITYQSKDSVDWFNRLLHHEEFNDLAILMYNEEIKPIFMGIPQMVADYMAEENFMVSVNRNFERWDKLLGHKSVYGQDAHSYASTYESEVQYMLDWIRDRLQYMNDRYKTGSKFYHYQPIESVQRDSFSAA